MILTAAAGAGIAGWSVDQLRRNHWNIDIIRDDHAPLAASIPTGLAVAAVGAAAGAVASRHLNPAEINRFVDDAVLLSTGATAIGFLAGGATTLFGMSDAKRADPTVWEQQILGWAGPGVAVSVGAAATIAAVSHLR